MSRTNHGTDEVRYEHLASGRDSAVTPRPWDHSGALARLWLESLVRPRTRLKRCRAWLSLRCWCSPSCARCSTTVCSRIDRRRVRHLGPNTPSLAAVRSNTHITFGKSQYGRRSRPGEVTLASRAFPTLGGLGEREFWGMLCYVQSRFVRGEPDATPYLNAPVYNRPWALSYVSARRCRYDRTSWCHVPLAWSGCFARDGF